MQDYELDEFLGGVVEVTPEQRAALKAAAGLVAARFPEEEEGQPNPWAERSYVMASQIILEDSTVREVAEAYTAARIVERDRWAELVGAMIGAAAAGVPETRIAQAAGVTRVTVRKALGK